jgi:hypothetical protein
VPTAGLNPENAESKNEIVVLGITLTIGEIIGLDVFTESDLLHAIKSVSINKRPEKLNPHFEFII